MSAVLEWATAGAPYPGELESGDRAVVATWDGGALAAMIDGLGHGAEAAVAARAAEEALVENAGHDLARIVERCHQGLRRTRGAVLAVAVFDARAATMTWAGVGNIEGLLVRANRHAPSPRESLVSRGGVVGYQLPSLRSSTIAIAPGDTLVLATDGIRSAFSARFEAAGAPQSVADAILADHRRGNDDACVLVARYVGASVGGVRVPVRDESDVGEARRRAREVAQTEGLPEAAVEALATAVSEVARNIVVHAGGAGEVRISVADEGGRRVVTVVAEDSGPGIAAPELALQDGFSTGSGLGLGLPSARRLVDDFTLASAPGRGTTVTLKKFRP